MTTRRNLLQKSALIGGATIAALPVHARYEVCKEVTKDEFQNAMSEHVIDWNDHYTNYRFLLETKCSKVDEVPQRLFNTVMDYMFDYYDMQDDDKYKDEEYGSDMVSRIHHAWDIASDRHQDMMFQYASFYELVAYEKHEIPLIPEEDEIGKMFIPSPSEFDGRPHVQYEQYGFGVWWDLKKDIDFVKEVDRMRDFLKKEGLWKQYRTIFKRTDGHNMDGFLEAWGLVSYIEFRNNNGL